MGGPHHTWVGAETAQWLVLLLLLSMNGFIELRYAKRSGIGGWVGCVRNSKVVVLLDNVHYYLFGVIQ